MLFLLSFWVNSIFFFTSYHLPWFIRAGGAAPSLNFTKTQFILSLKTMTQPEHTQRRHHLNVSFTAWLSFCQTPRWLFHSILALTRTQRGHHLQVSFTVWMPFRQPPRWFPLSCRRSRQTPGMTLPLRNPLAFQTCKQNHKQSHFQHTVQRL